MKGDVFDNPDEYVAAIGGWRRTCVDGLRKAVRAAGGFDEQIKWGHLVYTSHGPVLLIRAEQERVLFGFWRGRRLVEIEPRLKPSGKYEMATIELREGDSLKPAIARRLAQQARALNEELGDPRDAAKPTARRAPVRQKKAKAKRKTPKKKGIR